MHKRVVGMALTLAAVVAVAAQVSASSILLINGTSTTSEPGTTANITANFVAQATSLGHTVTVSDPVPASLAGYNQVWDFRFFPAISASEQSLYLSYLASGGGLFVMGENSAFQTRNDSVFALIAAAGGGALSFTSPCSTQTVNAPFTGPDPIPGNDVTYAAPGGSIGSGSGSFITDCGDGTGTALFFGVGDLSAAPAGALAVVFDVNWAEGTWNPPDDVNLLRNIIGGIQQEVEPVVPEPATLVLTGFGMGAAAIARRRKARRS
jgi:PEP-CTERM motif-containing protein